MRAILVFVRLSVLIPLLLCVPLACVFDTSGAMLPDRDPSDAGAGVDGQALPCDSDVTVQLSIGGVSEEPTPGQPYVHALLGDVVELSARGSCVREGPLVYEWQVSPIDETRTTAEPSLQSEVITIVPVLAEEYAVTLRVSGGSASAQKTVLGISAYGWQRRGGSLDEPDVRALATGAEHLWLAHEGGAHALALDDGSPGDEFVDLAAESTGEPIPENLGSAYYSDETGLLWLASDESTDRVLQVAFDVAEPAVVAVAIDGSGELGGPARVFAISGRNRSVAVATDRGLAHSQNGNAFNNVFRPDGGGALYATVGGTRGYTGGPSVFDLSAMGAPFDPFDGAVGSDIAVRALAVDAERQELWIATSGHGIARVDNSGPLSVIAIYDTANGQLESDEVRALAIEQQGLYAGDVWAATDRGIARYVRTRDRWLQMGNLQGLQERLDVQALAIDEQAGRRAIYAGSNRGLVSLQSGQ